MAKLVAVLLALVVLLAPAHLLAAGRIEVPRGHALELALVAGRYEAVFDVRNVGDDSLFISRVAPRTDADDVRLPRHLVARFESGQTSATIAPHASARVRVSWTPELAFGSHLRAFYGHVMITSTDEAAGEVAVGIAAHVVSTGVLGRHVLSLMVALPLLVSVLLGFLLIATAGERTGRRSRAVALAGTLGCAALALLAWAMFDPQLSRAEGGDGFQFTERASLVRALGIEVFLGVDGASLPLVVVCAIAAPCGVLASWNERRTPSVFFACYTLGVGASLGALVALDAAVFFVCLALAVAAVFLLIGLYGRKDASAAASRVLVLCGIGLALLAIALGALHGIKAPSFLIDGSPVSHTWAFPELARVDYVGSRAMLFGAPLAKGAFVLSFIGLAIVAGLFPFHAWLAPALRSAPPAASLLVCVGLTRVAMLGLLRIDVVLLPEAARWAAPTLAALGAAGALYGALVAMGERNLAGTASFGLVSLSGAVLVGVASLTPQALLGAIGGMAASGCAVAAVVLALGTLRDRIGTLELRDIRGLAIEAPLLAATLGVAALGAGAIPGTASFWTTWLIGIGAVVREPGVAACVLLGAVLVAASQAMPAMSIVRGRLPEALRRGERLTPYGGRVPDLRPGKLAALAPLLLVIVALGFYPSPLLGRAQTTARDMNDLVNPAGPGQIE